MPRLKALTLPQVQDPTLARWIREVNAAFLDPFYNITEIASSYTFEKGDELVESTSSNVTITLPSAKNVRGKVVYVKNRSSGDINVRGQGGQTIESATTLVPLPSESYSLYSDGTNWRIF